MPFEKGKSGNPGGRTAGYLEFRKKCQVHTDEALEALVAALSDPDYRVQAGKVLLEFGWGKATQAVELTGADGEPFSIKVVHASQVLK